MPGNMDSGCAVTYRGCSELWVPWLPVRSEAIGTGHRQH